MQLHEAVAVVHERAVAASQGPWSRNSSLGFSAESGVYALLLDGVDADPEAILAVLTGAAYRVIHGLAAKTDDDPLNVLVGVLAETFALGSLVGRSS
jgi:hypothetical protein